MSTTSKSPKDVLTEAWSVASQVFPKYSHKNSPKKFTQGQLFACLVIKNFLKLDYRGLQNLLVDCSDLTAAIELKSVPHFTTFQKASRKLLAAEPVHRLLDETVSRMMGKRKYVQLAAVDSTGLESTAASPYFVKRRSRQENPWKTVVYHRYPKLAIVCKTFDQFIIAFDTYRGPKPDVDEFKVLMEPELAVPSISFFWVCSRVRVLQSTRCPLQEVSLKFIFAGNSGDLGVGDFFVEIPESAYCN
ncbi:MAG: hypothetical protein ABL888_01600 [Pirellulaceae bacterium]